MKRLAFVLLAIFGVILIGSCGSERLSEPLHYRTTITFLRDGARQTASSVNVLTAARRHYVVPGITGWITDYKLSGVAIIMPASGGHLLALLDDQAGMAVDFSQGKKISSGFSQGWPLDEAWIDAWNRLALSHASAVTSSTIHPRLFFLPTGGTLADGRVIDWQQSAQVGLLLEDTTVEITREQLTPDPPLLTALGCTGQVDLGQTSQTYAADPPTCSSLVFRGLQQAGE